MGCNIYVGVLYASLLCIARPGSGPPTASQAPTRPRLPLLSSYALSEDFLSPPPKDTKDKISKPICHDFDQCFECRHGPDDGPRCGLMKGWLMCIPSSTHTQSDAAALGARPSGHRRNLFEPESRASDQRVHGEVVSSCTRQSIRIIVDRTQSIILHRDVIIKRPSSGALLFKDIDVYQLSVYHKIL